MTANGWLQIAVFFGIILLCTKPLGLFIERVIEGKRHFLSGALGWLERLIYRVCGINPEEEQHWTGYAFALLAFSVVSALLLYGLQRLQGLLPFNPQHFA